MANYIRTFAGWVIGLFALLLFGERTMFDVIGYTTAADDAELLRQRAPKFIENASLTVSWKSTVAISAAM